MTEAGCRRRRGRRAPSTAAWRVAVGGLSLLCAALAAVGSTSEGSPEAERRRLEALRRDLADAWSSGDLAAFLDGVDDDVRVLPPGEEYLEGRGLLDAWARRRMALMAWPGPSDGELSVGADLAYAAGTRSLATYRRGADGRWRLLALIWTGPRERDDLDAATPGGETPRP